MILPEGNSICFDIGVFKHIMLIKLLPFQLILAFTMDNPLRVKEWSKILILWRSLTSIDKEKGEKVKELTHVDYNEKPQMPLKTELAET